MSNITYAPTNKIDQLLNYNIGTFSETFMDNMQDVLAQANAHADKAVRLFRWATLISEAGRLGHMPCADVDAMSAEINRKAIEELNNAIALRRHLSLAHVTVM